jgi:cytoskeleton-associated protein 5
VLTAFSSFKFFQPAEMGLEEIERRLGSLLQLETISQLKSTIWKERLEGSLSSTFDFL